MLLLQILLIPFKLVIKLIFLILTGIVKLTSLPFKLVSLLASMFTGLLGGGIAVIGVGFTASGFMGQISTETPNQDTVKKIANALNIPVNLLSNAVLVRCNECVYYEGLSDCEDCGNFQRFS